MSDQLPDGQNDHLILISGKPASGKSASMRNIRNKSRWLNLITEAGKRPPFKNDFQNHRISDPYQVNEAFDVSIKDPNFSDGICIDSMTFLMDMFESQYVLPSTNTMAAWGQYAQFFKNLMQVQVVDYGKPVVIMAHVLDTLNEKQMEMETAVPVKGSLKNNGIEAYFSTVVSTKRMSVKDLEPFKSEILTITEEEEMLGFKYVFQTRLTAKSLGERIRSPMGMFSPAETFMDNDAQLLLDRLKDFYGS